MLSNQQKAAKYHADTRSCAELVPWLYPFNDRLLVNKDTGLLACFEYEGIDTDGVTVSQLNAQAEIAEYANKMFADKPITVWWRVDRKKVSHYPTAPFPDPISQSIDDARRQEFTHGNNRVNIHSLAVLMTPNVGRDRFMARLRRLMMLNEGISYHQAAMEALKSFVMDRAVFAYTNDELHQAVERFEELMNAFQGAFANNVRFRRIEKAQLGAFLQRTFSHLSRQEAVALPKDWFLDSYIPDAYVTPEYDHLVFEGSTNAFAKVITIKSFPQPEGDASKGYTVPGMLDKLMMVPGDISFTQVFRYASKAKALKYMKSIERYNDIAKYGLKGLIYGAVKGTMDGAKVNSGREKELKQVNEAVGNLSVDQATAGWYNCTIVCYGDTLEKATDVADIVDSTIRSAKFVPFPEKEHALSAWAGTIPGNHGEIVRWKFLDNANLANLIPLRTISRGQVINEYLTDQLKSEQPPLAVLSTDSGTIFYFVHYVMHLGHMLFVGPSRTGKTTKANFLWTMFRKYPRARFIGFDIDYSVRIPVLLQGGNYIDYSDDTESRPKNNPLVLLKDSRHLAYLVRFVKLLCEMRGYSVSATQEKDIIDALRATASMQDPLMLRLLTVYTQLSDSDLKQQLELWVGDAPYARYFDNVEDDFNLANALGMETRTILKNEMLAVPFMDLAFYRIQSQMADEKNQGVIVPTVIYCPEVWYFFKNPKFAEQIENYLKTIARYASALWMDTQSPDELMKSGIYGSLRDNIKTVIFTRNRKALSASLYKIYSTEFGLVDSQIRRIAASIAQKDYFIHQDDLSRMVRPNLDRRSLAILASDRRAQVIFDRHYRNGSPIDQNWKERYIEEMLSTTATQSDVLEDDEEEAA